MRNRSETVRTWIWGWILVVLLGCGGALPSVMAGISTAAEILSFIEDTLSPQYQDAQDVCLVAIETLPRQSKDLVEAVGVCNELTDAWLAVLQAAERLEVASEAGHKEYLQDMLEATRQRIKEYNESYLKYEWSVK